MGRSPTPDQLATIERHLAAGSGVRAACAAAKVDSLRLYHDMHASPELAARIARARASGQDALVAETLEIADAATESTHNVARLRIWARQWHAAKVAPRKYGDKVTTEVTGADGGPVVLTWRQHAQK